jgi:hypothetical protein
VASLRWPAAHSVLVYPFLKIRPAPDTAIATQNGRPAPLQRFETGCTTFSFVVTGNLGASRSYPIRAAVADPPPGGSYPRGAEYLLDAKHYGTPRLQLETIPPNEPEGDWRRGVLLSLDDLKATHQLCVSTGRHVAAGSVRLPVRFRLMQSPYHQLPVVDDFTLDFEVAAPGFWERYMSLLVLGLIAVLTALMWWYLRFRPSLPDDMRVAVDGDPSGTVIREPSLASRLLALRSDRAVYAAGGARLGAIRPVARALYQLKPDGGAEESVGGEWKPAVQADETGDTVESAAERDFLVRMRTGASRLFRIVFE